MSRTKSQNSTVAAAAVLPPLPHGHAGSQPWGKDGAEEVKPAACPSLVEAQLPAIVNQAILFVINAFLGSLMYSFRYDWKTF